MTLVGNGNKPGGHKATQENNAKAARRRQHEAAERVNQVEGIPQNHRNYLIPQVELDLTDEHLRYIGQLIAGVEDFKILRSSVAVLSLTTSTKFAHLLTDASLLSRSSTLVAVLYEVPRSYLFGDDHEPEDDA